MTPSVCIGPLDLGPFPLLLAPMEDVSDPPFRAVCKQGGADLMYTEFISSEGLIRDAVKSKQKLDIFDYERPVGIQIFGGDEEAMAISAGIVETVNPDLLDKVYKGSELEGIMLQHPFYDKQVPIILGEYVTTEAGTGAVHTAPAHGQDDYEVGLKYNLPVAIKWQTKFPFHKLKLLLDRLQFSCHILQQE